MTHPDPPFVRGDAPDAAAALRSALEDDELVLVHRGVELADGAPARLVAVIHRPHRRLVRVHTTAGHCYLARTELLHAAITHGVPVADLLADGPGLDTAVAEAAGAVPPEGPTPIDDPASGRWRVWVDGAVVGVRPVGSEADPGWARDVARRGGRTATAVAVARRRAGRVRRELVRLRQRPQAR